MDHSAADETSFIISGKGSRSDYDLTELLRHWASLYPERVWLSERRGDVRQSWTWRQAADEAFAMAAWLEERLEGRGHRVAILSRNRVHWMLADLAIMAAGHVTVPLFTTQTHDIVKYISEFAGIDIVFIGEAENWDRVRAAIPSHVEIIRLPGVVDGANGQDWDDIISAYRGRRPRHRVAGDDLATIVFTSGTTGLPKGVMHSHRSLILPLLRSVEPLGIKPFARFISYLPLAHLAEREQVFAMSLVLCGSIHFLERRETLLRDLRDTQPTFFFGAPRIWEQLQQATLSEFGGQAAFAKAIADDATEAIERTRRFLGLNAVDCVLSGSAPISRALLEFYDTLGLTLLDGFGQTEAMGLMCTTRNDRRLGSVGKPVAGVEARLSEDGELLVKADGFSSGYFGEPDKTAETFVDGWVHTGDRARIDEDGFFFITGRVKDYFKTIHGKYVAPAPIEHAFAREPLVDQKCLLGRGYSKTVMICTLSPEASSVAREALVAALTARVTAINAEVEKHARIGAVIVASREWTIENGFLTVTLKVRRDVVETAFDDLARRLALRSAEQKNILIAFEDSLKSKDISVLN